MGNPAILKKVNAPSGFERYFQISLYLMVLSGFIAISSTHALDVLSLFFVGSALLCRGYFLFINQDFLIPDSWTSFLTLGYVAFYLLDFFFFSGSFLNATVHLVLFVMIVRLFSAKRDRDYYFLATLSFLMVLAAAILTVDSLFLLAFSVFLIMTVSTFILMEMRSAAGKATIPSKHPEDEVQTSRMARSLAATVPAIVALILVGAAAIFFILPRVSAGYLSSYAIRNELSTGFSDRVELGQIGQIQQSNTVAMHIQVEGDTAGALDVKWRGVALNLFDGRVWSNSHPQHIAPRTSSGRFLLNTDQHLLQPHEVPFIHYRVMMEPIGTNVFFLAARALDLQGPYRMVASDSGGAVFNMDGSHPVSTYEATSDTSTPGPAELRDAAASYGPDVSKDYLQLPQLDPRIAPLAAKITGTAHNNYDKAVAIEKYLQTHFAYTLQLSRTRPRDPIAEFLFVRKEGHCEYFASSMAVMLRTEGIPSRVVNGFRGEEFNDITSQYVIRNSNAHSWVEAYFPGYGWVSFDPTPSGPAAAHSGWSRMLLYIDALQTFWRERVVEYDAGQQVALGQSTIHSSHHAYVTFKRWLERHYQTLLEGARHTQANFSHSPKRWVGFLVTGIFFLILITNLPRLWSFIQQNRLAAHPEKSPNLAAQLWYERMTRALGRRGWRKPPTQTPGEFALSIEDEKIRLEVARFTRHYEWARFGGSTQDAQLLPELYQTVVASTNQ